MRFLTDISKVCFGEQTIAQIGDPNKWNTLVLVARCVDVENPLTNRTADRIKSHFRTRKPLYRQAITTVRASEKIRVQSELWIFSEHVTQLNFDCF